MYTAVILAVLAPLAAARAGDGEDPASFEGRTVLGVSVYGNYRLDRGFVVRTFGIDRGDEYRGEAIEAGLRRVEELAGVRYAAHNVVTDTKGGGVYILVIVTEEPTRTIAPLINRNFLDRIAVGLSYTERNLRGLNERLHLSALVNGAAVFEGRWSKPAFAAVPQLGIELSGGYRRYRWPYPSFEPLILDDRIRRIEGAFGLRLNPSDILSLRLAAGAERIDAGTPMLDGQGTGGVPDAPSGTLAVLEGGVELVSLDRPFYPRAGVRLGASVRSWGLAQSAPPFELTRGAVEGVGFIPLGRMVLALFARESVCDGDTPAYLYEHLGGTATIRGYEYGIFRGENSLLLRSDLRVPLNHTDLSDLGNPMILVSLALFADAGAAWDRDESLDIERMHGGFGLGLDFIPKEGWLLKAGYAWPMDPDGRWFFNIGTSY